MATDGQNESYRLEPFDDAFQKVKAQVTTDLSTCAVMLQRLLMAVDLFPLGTYKITRGTLTNSANVRGRNLLECAVLAGGLSKGHYAEQAIRRYWLLWMPMLHKQQNLSARSAEGLVPPLDVQWAWLVHRLNPTKYLADCTARFGAPVHPANVRQALGFSSNTNSSQALPNPQAPPGGPQSPSSGYHGGVSVLTRQVWEADYPTGPGQPPEHVFWPPAPAPATVYCSRVHAKQQGCPKPHLCPHPQSCHHVHLHPKLRSADLAAKGCYGNGSGGGDGGAPAAAAAAAAAGSFASVRGYVVESMLRQGRFLHQTLRYFYQDPDFLEAGRIRYFRFLALARTQSPGASPLNPMYDQDLMWHSHMALSGSYVADCEVIMPYGRRPLRHDDTLDGTVLVDSFKFTLERYESLTGLMVNPSPTRKLPTFMAQPLVAHLWPLAAALSDPRVAELPPPRKLAAELRAGGMLQPRPPHLEAPQSPPPAMGSPDHLCRNGTFAMFGLWSLADRLGLGLGGSGGAEGKGEGKEGGEKGRKEGVTATTAPVEMKAKEEEPVGSSQTKSSIQHQHQQLNQQDAAHVLGSTSANGVGGGGGGGGGLLGSCFKSSTLAEAGAAGGGGGGGGAPRTFSDGELEAAVRFMTRRLLQLADLTDPTSPLASHQHPFLDVLAPLPGPPATRGSSPGDPAAAAAAASPSTFPSSSPSFPVLQQPLHNQQPQPAPTSTTTTTTTTVTANCSTPVSTTTSTVTTTSRQGRSEEPGGSDICRTKTDGSGGGGGGGLRRRRHPSPAPRIDVPCGDLAPSLRGAQWVYLAPHQYAPRGRTRVWVWVWVLGREGPRRGALGGVAPCGCRVLVYTTPTGKMMTITTPCGCTATPWAVLCFRRGGRFSWRNVTSKSMKTCDDDDDDDQLPIDIRDVLRVRHYLSWTGWAGVDTLHTATWFLLATRGIGRREVDDGADDVWVTPLVQAPLEMHSSRMSCRCTTALLFGKRVGIIIKFGLGHQPFHIRSTSPIVLTNRKRQIQRTYRDQVASPRRVKSSVQDNTCGMRPEGLHTNNNIRH
ncbi:hypothetical protein VOLCADRAFT_87826 [Volvox carteri f. nagariensis]|uniref:Uncharacterized protein n=1 Tax=Volvox carteri f. nagariensis TaxID=3068 RepID=D8TMC6_VOLCA|nr:uncharacterized protein VOLCADRAFT_87826 [Volvox carteri f. nagariensis]EFJ51478.1 hypothetical protein VOLCADRAFT_87826 [Volvox carteri f. nagariensis]|eukprot:XP_002947430.1 hypothetical protein VOLCADRAFT_87826 [Volvox carteri f. nagariensis]